MALRDSGDLPDYVQFVDGDCLLVPGWIAAGMAHARGATRSWDRHRLAVGDSTAMPASTTRSAISNGTARPAPIAACGGDMMVRAPAFFDLDGFNPQVIAAEDDEFCVRMRKSGLADRTPAPDHDPPRCRDDPPVRMVAARGAQRAWVCAGRAICIPIISVRERRRVWLYGLVLPLVALGGLGLILSGCLLTGLLVVVAAMTGYELSWLRTMQGLVRAGLPTREAMHHALYLSLSKFPNLIGMLTYHWRRWQRRDMNIIEYK